MVCHCEFACVLGRLVCDTCGGDFCICLCGGDGGDCDGCGQCEYEAGDGWDDDEEKVIG